MMKIRFLLVLATVFLAIPALHAQGEAKKSPLDRFNEMDLNKDGAISKAEWKGDAKLFESMDGNSDGSVTLEEAKGFLAKKMKETAGGGEGGKAGKKALPESIARTADLVYKKVGSQEIKLDLYKSKAPAPASPKAPLLIYIHGGGFVGGSKDHLSISGVALPLLEAGWVVASIDYRLCTDKGPKLIDCITDCKDAIRYLVKNAAVHGIDTSRISVIGTSAGATLSLMLGLTGDDAFPGEPTLAGVKVPVTCAVSWFGVCDFTKKELFQERTKGTEATKILFKDPPEKSLTDYELCSPVKYISKKSRPMFLAHGDKDVVVPFIQSVAMEAACQQVGAPLEFLRVANAGHGFGPAGGEVTPAKGEIDKKTVEFLLKNNR